MYVRVRGAKFRSGQALLPVGDAESEKDIEETVTETCLAWLEGLTIQGLHAGLEKNSWQRHTLAEIHSYSLRNDHGGLQNALQLILLFHTMMTPFVVPAHGREHLTRGYDDSLVTSFLTGCIYLHFKVVAMRTLKDLGNLLASRETAAEGLELIFCEAFLCLVVLGRCQIAVLNHTLADRTFETVMAHRQIRLMEDEMIRHIIELCVYVFRRQTSSEAMSLSAFFTRLQQITATCGHGQTELETNAPSYFERTNVPRLLNLLRFSIPCLRSSEKVPCPFTGCTSSFGRKAEVDRHFTSIHNVKLIDCDVNNCSRKGENGFARKDHLLEHKRGYHQMSIQRKRLSPIGNTEEDPRPTPRLRKTQ